jgi:hypothetical protein
VTIGPSLGVVNGDPAIPRQLASCSGAARSTLFHPLVFACLVLLLMAGCSQAPSTAPTGRTSLGPRPLPLARSAPLQIFATAGKVLVSCADPDLCAAVDTETGRARVLDDNYWHDSQLISRAGVAGVSCSAGVPLFCMAIGPAGVAIYAHQRWSAAADPLIAEPLTSVSCTSPIFCTVSDASGNTAIFSGLAWRTSTHLTGLAPQIFCTSSTFCVALAVDGELFQFRGSEWRDVRKVQIDGNLLMEPACASESLCLVGDTIGRIYQYDGHSLTAIRSTAVAPDGISAMSCYAPTQCIGVGTGVPIGLKAVVIRYDSGLWSAMTLAGVGPLDDVSCTASGFCLASLSSGDVLTITVGT